MFMLFTHFMTAYRLYKGIRGRYLKFRPLIKELVDDTSIKFDDKAMKVVDVIFFYKD